jgi:hypothetical protein
VSKINKIFGIGLGRTGTKSLARAMHQLGYSVKHAPKDIRIIKKLDFVNDIDIAWRFEFFDHVFPNSKFILTTRDIGTWMESNKARTGKRGTLRMLQNRYMMYKTTDFDETKFRIAYYEYHARVYKYFEDRPDDLLVMDFSKGNSWESLCNFLGKEIPNFDYPHIHKTKEEKI